MTENDESKSIGKSGRRRLALEASVLFVFAWITAIVISLFRPVPMDSTADFGMMHFIGSTFGTGLETFVFGYVLSRFFKQFKTGCAIVIILFFAYLIWAGRHPR